MGAAKRLTFLRTAILLGLVSLAFAHGHEAVEASSEASQHAGHGEDASATDMSANKASHALSDGPPSYWSHPEHVGLIYAHIGLMVLAWVIALPLAVVFSIAKTRPAIPFQILFLVLNGVGNFFGFVYNRSTPDLYQNNSHHKSAWAITWLAVIWAVMSVFKSYAVRMSRDRRGSYQPITSQAMEAHQQLHGSRSPDHRWSRDSGQGTERNTASLCQSSRSNSWPSEPDSSPNSKLYGNVETDDDDDALSEKYGLFRNHRIDRFLSRHVPRLAVGRMVRVIDIIHIFFERTILILGFVALVTGVAVYGGIARGRDVFNVLAHFIKGGIFFWYGLLTFGRWMGCFGDFGWAWNLKPTAEIVGSRKARVPSAEFTESFVIWLYGASNVFLEHLNAWGHAWTATDLEHVSITIMFFGGGLLGMLIESRRVRSLFSSSISSSGLDRADTEVAKAPDSYQHPLNPVPGLVILLLGLMMSSHTQHSMVSSMIHKQWGTLFVGFAMARAVTYVILWLKPPSSFLASRPPSEIVASFCLIGGGIIFMSSNGDTVKALEAYELDAMFVFTVVMGLTSLVMGWELLVLAIKNWSVRRSKPSPVLFGHSSTV